MQKADLEQLLQSRGWALLANSLRMMLRADEKAICQTASCLDDLILKNSISARYQVMLTLVDLPSNMLKDVERELEQIYEDSQDE